MCNFGKLENPYVPLVDEIVAHEMLPKRLGCYLCNLLCITVVTSSQLTTVWFKLTCIMHLSSAFSTPTSDVICYILLLTSSQLMYNAPLFCFQYADF